MSLRMATLPGGSATQRRGTPGGHLDIFGTIMLFFGPFGWAKPVPVNPYYFTNPKRDNLLVSLAGPASNIVLALAFGWTLRLLPASLMTPGLLLFFQFCIGINIGIAFFNLIPVPPLDGSHILTGLLPNHLIPSYYNKMRYMPVIFMGLLIAEWGLHIPLFSSIIYPFYKPFAAFWSYIIFFKF
jgi:Zn-dependent protease